MLDEPWLCAECVGLCADVAMALLSLAPFEMREVLMAHSRWDFGCRVPATRACSHERAQVAHVICLRRQYFLEHRAQR